jgi:hypothetical protein
VENVKRRERRKAVGKRRKPRKEVTQESTKASKKARQAKR